MVAAVVVLDGGVVKFLTRFNVFICWELEASRTSYSGAERQKEEDPGRRAMTKAHGGRKGKSRGGSGSWW